MMGKSRPLVTIGIPTHNRANSFLKACLDSAVGQTYPDVEIIISDNASTDHTEELVRSYSSDRIRYTRHNSAVTPPENADYCLDNADGEYFILLHDDDVLDEDFVEACIEAIGDREVGLVHTGVREIDENGKTLKHRPNPHTHSSVFDYFRAVLRGRAVTYFCNTLYHTERLRGVGGFKSPAYTYQDVAANVRVAFHFERVEIEEPKAGYRIHGFKLGSLMGLDRWSDDSLFLIDLMCELMPEHAEYFRGEGKRHIFRRCLGKARRLPTAFKRLEARCLIYRKFGWETVQDQLILDRFRNAVRRLTPGSLGSAR